MSPMMPRVVVVRRASEYQELIAHHGTRDQANFFLKARGRSLDELAERGQRLEDAIRLVAGAIPSDWRRNSVLRADLDRFLFEPDDIVVAIGQDGLVANVAKYLTGQPVIGLNPEPDLYEGVLVPHPPQAISELLRVVGSGSATFAERTMVEARTDDGRRLLALNEVFLGQATHQSARYVLRAGEQEEQQSSSGIVVTTGTGATGWGRSIALERGCELPMPSAEEPALAFFVREAWPSVATGASLTEGLLRDGARLEVASQMNSSGVVFGDGIEGDTLEFLWGCVATVGVAQERLRLVVA